MADPINYTPGYDFSGWQASHPSTPLPADEVDSELANISQAINDHATAIKSVRRSDGQLKNLITTYDSLNDDLKGRFDIANAAAIAAAASAQQAAAYVGMTTSLQYPLAAFGLKGDGTDETAQMIFALASGVPMTGQGKTYGVTGQINLPANLNLSDTTFKQLAPGASLSVITLKSVNVSKLTLRRVKVNRNGDGTNGGLLNASGTNGALNTAFGMWLEGGKNHYFEDLEVFGNDSGTGIIFSDLDATSTIIRPYVHDMLWSRTTATDDQVEGILVIRCAGTEFSSPKVSNLTGVLNGTPTPRFTRGLPVGESSGARILNPYIKGCDQGIDLTGADNFDIKVINPVVQNIYVWGIKLANHARRCQIISGLATDCGVGFVASGSSGASTTDRNEFIDCVSINAGSNGQTVVGVAGFRVLSDGTEAGTGARTKFIRCNAIDNQTVKTMTYGFASEPTNIAYAPELENCQSSGHITAMTAGVFTHYAVGTVANDGTWKSGAVIESGGTAPEAWVKYADGTLIQSTTILETTTAWNVATGSSFRRANPLTWTFPKAFVGSAPNVTASAGLVGGAEAAGCSYRAHTLNDWTGTPWCAVTVDNVTIKRVMVIAHGRWY